MKKVKMVMMMINERNHQGEKKSNMSVAQLRRGAQRAILREDVALEAERRNSKESRYLTHLRQKRHENVWYIVLEPHQEIGNRTYSTIQTVSHY